MWWYLWYNLPLFIVMSLLFMLSILYVRNASIPICYSVVVYGI
ncbi:putative membrane protein [Escherichia coli 3-105-05_S1_C1]|nr:putative membrane protein [Escherichia coli 3-105-05_S1_C1]KDT48467.1 putative membrane protein [Escherichia coli 3-105-05_S4_C3]KDW49533.1 putative membrane protein [Escherichia coli 1-392-07_S3_C2]KDZ77855.1 putative membrane protein [Escherichia coli 3-105-05_S1_C2]KEO35931.1 putative membrane protein [Escherichia coli 1-250-04_S3_C2]